ncbi:cysteine rich trypsin inhibitor-like protein 10 [Sarcoptes scabiei]|uniref:Cysteine rich trypsin inhibitor-like protein 10 n=1 Tax=Sarcoptes scabiei TaxID=52283 RepID=A0A132AJB3_SARSC|nr:cysteine rich trypsin inhibitor-like protein 10 [Sarcoptes scabiei]
MLRQLLLLCLVAIVIDQALIVSANAPKSKNLKRPHHPHCPPHSHWAPCGRSCPRTCARPHGPLKCPLSCKPGCKCDRGYVRKGSDGNGPCVRRRHCKRPHHRCPKHSHWAPCGRSCPRTCARPHGPLKCPLSCKPGCKCDRGYVRKGSNGGGPCVRRNRCKNHHKKHPKKKGHKKGPKKHHKKGPKKNHKKDHKKSHKKD